MTSKRLGRCHSWRSLGVGRVVEGYWVYMLGWFRGEALG